MTNLIQLHKDTGGTVKPNLHGYTEFHSNSSLIAKMDMESEPYRVYVNASTKNVVVLGRILVKLACLDGQAQYFKIADTASGVDERKDAIVIYTYGKDLAKRIADQLAKITGGSLTPTSPGLTQEVAPGISIGVDPYRYKDPVSFGQHRVRPFATALLCYRGFAADGFLDNVTREARTNAFRFLLAGAFRAHGINALDPSGSAPASAKSISNRADTSASAVTVPKPEQMAARLLLKQSASQKPAK
jgi:hypothetical protein